MVTIRRWFFFCCIIETFREIRPSLVYCEKEKRLLQYLERECVRDERLFVKDSEKKKMRDCLWKTVRDREKRETFCERQRVWETVREKQWERERDRHVTYETLVAVIVRADGTPGKICFPQDTLPTRWWITTSWCTNTTNHSNTSSPSGAGAAINQLINVPPSWPSLSMYIYLFTNAKQIHTDSSSTFISYLEIIISVLGMQCRTLWYLYNYILNIHRIISNELKMQRFYLLK